MAGSDLLSARLLAEALLAFLASSHPELASPDDVDDSFAVNIAGDDNAIAGIPPRLFEYLLSQEVSLESDLAEFGYAVPSEFRHGLAFTSGDDHGVRCVQGAVIDDDEFGWFVIKLDHPNIFGLISGDAERPLADRIRVVAYLIGLLSQQVRIPGSLVGLVSEGVRVLRQLVRLSRLGEGDDPGNPANPAKKTPDNAKHIQQVHETEPTKSATNQNAPMLMGEEE